MTFPGKPKSKPNTNPKLNNLNAKPTTKPNVTLIPMGQLLNAHREPKKQYLEKSHQNMSIKTKIGNCFFYNFCPHAPISYMQGDKLLGTIVHHFSVSISVLIIKSLNKIVRAVLPKLRKSRILDQICIYGSKLHAKFQENR